MKERADGRDLFEFGAEVLGLTVDLLPLLVALGLALPDPQPGPRRADRGQPVAVHGAADDACSTRATGSASLLWPRLVASVLQVAVGYGAVILWRYWRIGSERVTVH